MITVSSFVVITPLTQTLRPHETLGSEDQNICHEETDVLVIALTAVFMLTTCHNKRKLMEKVVVGKK